MNGVPILTAYIILTTVPRGRTFLTGTSGGEAITPKVFITVVSNRRVMQKLFQKLPLILFPEVRYILSGYPECISPSQISHEAREPVVPCNLECPAPNRVTFPI